VLELIFGTRTKIKILQILAAIETPLTRNEVVRLSHSGIRSIYEQIEELIAIGILKEIKNGHSKVTLDPEFPFYDIFRDLLLLSRDYFSTPNDVLKSIDKICGDNYYLGGFTAARQKIIPIDYDPPIYMVNILKNQFQKLYPRIKVLGKIPNIKVNTNMDELKEITIFINTCETIPPDVKRVDFLNVEVWIASVEWGIIECLIRKTPFTFYGTYLVLLQNRLDDVLDLIYFKKLAEEENCLPLILAIMSEFNNILSKEIFEITEKEKNIAHRAKSAVNEKEIKHAINTVMG
jgi:hypothetical protein